MSRPSALGRGLSALLGELSPVDADAPDAKASGVHQLPISAIEPDPGQPRRHFDDAALEELAASIRERGIVQPIVVRPHGSGYRIVAGERRWRAAQRARLHEIPALIREFSDSETLQVALLENIQRADLNAIEEAEAYRRLLDEFGHTQEALAKSVHKSRSHVANLLRLLDLPERVRLWVARGDLSMGHARALVGADQAEALGQQAIARGLSVRDVERLARARKPARRKATASAPSADGDADIAALERQLSDLLGLTVNIAQTEQGGTLTLGYSTLDQLDMLCQRLSGESL